MLNLNSISPFGVVDSLLKESDRRVYRLTVKCERKMTSPTNTRANSCRHAEPQNTTDTELVSSAGHFRLGLSVTQSSA